MWSVLLWVFVIICELKIWCWRLVMCVLMIMCLVCCFCLFCFCCLVNCGLCVCLGWRSVLMFLFRRLCCILIICRRV